MVTTERPPPFSHPRYEAGRELGRGAQGVVVRVVDREAPDRPLVAKVWRGGAFREQALLGEFALLARANIPGMVRAHDLGRCTRTGAPFLIEDFIDGPESDAWVQSAAPSSRSERLLKIVAEVAATLSLLHDFGFVHGDLKPAHVRIGTAKSAPRAVLLDLGAAVGRAREGNAPLALTPAFAAPEVLAGDGPSPLSDLFGLGALAYAIAVGKPPPRSGQGAAIAARPSLARRLGELAPWVPPSAAALIEQLLAEHPRDRPADAREVLHRLGAAQHAAGIAPGHPPPPIGRERELAQLLAPSGAAVRYLVGPSGVGKSHLARELLTRALLAGRSGRLLRFAGHNESGGGGEDGPGCARLVAFFRGSDLALPFLGADASADTPLLLVLDDLHLAPFELCAALDAYRCREGPAIAEPRPTSNGPAIAEPRPTSNGPAIAEPRPTSNGPRRAVEVLATTRAAPDGAESVELGPLDDASFAALCEALAIQDPAQIEATRIASGKIPGFVVAAAGRVPLTRDLLLDRLRGLSPEAADLLGAIAIVGGEAKDTFCRRFLGATEATPAPINELLAAALITRSTSGAELVYAQSAPALARDLAAALASFERVDRSARALLADPRTPAAALLAVAAAPCPPAERDALLSRAASKARAEGLRSLEIDALLALAASPLGTGRTAARLSRLERLSRDSGTAALHPQVLAWLDEAAEADPALLVLSLRRRAEQRAREGDADGARELAEQARKEAVRAGDPAAEALALATIGVTALYRASWGEADRALGEARARVSAIEAGHEDPEEVARIDHNLGVIALYRGRSDEAKRAFERALAIKRSLGDRAGMRSCLLNLGLALAKLGRLDEAERVLDESIQLARSLGQAAGRGWGLAARADVAVRRRDAAAARGWIAEAESLARDLPAAVRADLAILHAEVALLEGDGARALAATAGIEEALRESDPLIHARALVIEANAHLARLPVDARRAARLAIAAIRSARRTSLPEALTQALAALKAALSRRARRALPRTSSPLKPPPLPRPSPPSPPAEDEAIWTWLSELAAGAPPSGAAIALARLIARKHAAERAFVAAVGSAGEILAAWGADLDGLPIAAPDRRIDAELSRAALGREGPVYLGDVETSGGRGSRLAVASKEPLGAAPPCRAIVVLEHRFASFAFDRVTAAEAIRWATLAGLVLRLDPRGSRESRDGRPGKEEPDDADGETQGRAPSPSSSPPPSRMAPELSTVSPVIRARRSFPGILGQSAALKRALGRLDAAIDGDLPVLIAGETGAGKEVFARALHELGRRSGRPLVTVNCGAIPDALFEAELFGHARGSFTGADRARPGLFARADKGTLFLDEIGELPLLRQAALLRALQERRYRPVGSDEEIPFDVRVVAATNRDLERAVAEGAFRKDLLYRLNAVEIRIPPLRERAEDIPDLARAFLAGAGSRARLAPAALEALGAYPWPGNVRELEHVMQRLALLRAGVIEFAHLPRQIRGHWAALPAKVAAPSRGDLRPRSPEDEREEVARALAANSGNISRAALSLGLSRQGLKKRMVRLGMRAPAAGSGEGPLAEESVVKRPREGAEEEVS
jgi:serine/threonine-protein kinase PknK